MTNLLVVATTVSDSPGVRAAIADLVAPGAKVHVVSPASKLSKLQWLTNEEGEARARAEEVAEAAEAALANQAQSVWHEVGDVDPIQATEDALRTFQADQIVVLVRPQDEAAWLERAAVEDGFERFGLPVRYLVIPNGSGQQSVGC